MLSGSVQIEANNCKGNLEIEILRCLFVIG